MPRTFIKWFALLTLVGQLFATRNEAARDYFFHKNVRSVVAFLCRKETIDDLDLTRRLNEDGVSLAIIYPEFRFTLERILTVNYYQSGVILDLHCPNWYSELVIAESSKLGAYTELYRWLIFGRSLNESIRMVNDDAFGIGTDLVIATPGANEYSYHFHDVYNPCKERQGKLNVTEFGYWSKGAGLNVTLLQEKYQRRGNLHGMKLKVISVTQYRPENVPLKVHLQDYGTKPLDSMAKFAYAIFLHMSDMFNFTMEIVETNFWEQIQADGTHLGMIGMLHRNEADLGATPGVISKERAVLSQLISPIWPFRSCFVFRSVTTKVNDQLLRPFTPKSWTVTVVVVLTCVVVLGVALRQEFSKDGSNGTWNEAMLATASIMCQQGSTLAPDNLSTRIVLVYLLLFGLLIYNYYSASVVSAQLNLPVDKMNDSLHQLTKSNLKVAAEPITYTNYGLTALSDWEVKEFYLKRWTPLSDDERYLPLEEGLARVAEGGFAYHMDPNTAYPYMERLYSDRMICELTEIHLFKPQRMALWGRRGSPFTKIARICLAKLKATGILNRQINRWASRKPVCFREAFTVQSVSILTIAPALMMLCVGILLASVICVVENFIEKCTNT